MRIHSEEGKGDFLQAKLKHISSTIWALTHLYTMDNEQVLRQEQDSYFYWVKIRPVISLGVGNYFDFDYFLIEL